MKQEEWIGISRRRLFEVASRSTGAALLTRLPLFADQTSSDKVKPVDLPAIKPGTNTSIGPDLFA